MGNLGLVQVSGAVAILAGVLCLTAATIYRASDVSAKQGAIADRASKLPTDPTPKQQLAYAIEEQALILKVLHEHRVAVQIDMWLQLGGYLLAIFVALGLYQTLSEGGSYLWMAVFAWIIGSLCLAFFHVMGIAATWELAPAYLAADESTQPAIAIMFQTFARVGELARAVGSFLTWGCGLGLFSLGILSTDTLPKWIGVMGLGVAFLGGWMAIVAPFAEIFQRFGMLGSWAELGQYGAQLWLLLAGVAMVRQHVPVLVAPDAGEAVPAE